MSKLTTALIQTHQAWHDPAANREHFGRLMENVDKGDLVVLPGMFTTGFTMDSVALAEEMDGPTTNWMREISQRLNTHVCGSVIITEDGQYFNRFILASPDGKLKSYDKRHLFRMADEHNHFSSGTERQIFTINGIRICPQVCYDLRFPVFTRNQQDYVLLLFVANWPAARRNHWRTLLTARAIENQAYVIGLNRIGVDGNNVEYCGDSGLINANGEWLADLTNEDLVAKVELNFTELNQFREGFPAWRDADQFSLDEH